MQEGCTHVPVPKLELRIPIADKYEVSERVLPMVEPNILNTRFTTVEFNLWKNVLALAVEDESG